MTETPAPLLHGTVEEILEALRKQISKEIGVTLVHDANGVYGPMGRWYLTLRFSLKKKADDLITVSTVIEQVSSSKEDNLQREDEARWRDK